MMWQVPSIFPVKPCGARGNMESHATPVARGAPLCVPWAEEVVISKAKGADALALLSLRPCRLGKGEVAWGPRGAPANTGPREALRCRSPRLGKA